MTVNVNKLIFKANFEMMKTVYNNTHINEKLLVKDLC